MSRQRWYNPYLCIEAYISISIEELPVYSRWILHIVEPLHSSESWNFEQQTLMIREYLLPALVLYQFIHTIKNSETTYVSSTMVIQFHYALL